MSPHFFFFPYSLPIFGEFSLQFLLEHPLGLWLSRNENPVQMVSLEKKKITYLVIMQVWKNNLA